MSSSGTASSSGTGDPNIRWERLQELFSRAVELPEQERGAFIVARTDDDPGLRDELLEMLACDRGKSTSPLTNALGAAIDATTRDRRRAALGKVIGNYKLVSVLGHGGTGTVYLGERADRQYSAQVAVKVVDNAGVHADLGMRFRAERQILASLNHSNIARLLDAGETPEGYPYIVMEYVHGEPVDRYCDREQLDLRDRLKLFLEICAAVQYAHQNLIVHRDLKPANVLVTPEGTPKLLDFGIAKLLDAGDAASALALTRMNDRLLTPEYASPEQILGQSVTTASDVYALGVVLYELLTGTRPYVVPATASQLELERSICVTDPQKPSSAVRRLIDAGPRDGQSDIADIAAVRRLTPERLQRRLMGDIDAIVMRAMRKEPQHRYGSIDQLAADIRHYLANEPVAARQGNWLYYSQRFVRRHTIGVIGGTGFFLFAVTVAISMSIQAQRIAAERDRATQEWARAEKVSNFMIDVFASAEPFQNLGQQVTAQDLLDEAARNIRGALGEQPEVRASLLEAIGRAYQRQDQPDRAIAYLQESLHIRGQTTPKDDVAMASTFTELAIAMRKASRYEEAEEAFRQAMAITQAGNNQRTETRARLLVDLGRLHIDRGQIDEAEKHLIQGLELTRDLKGPQDAEVASILSDIALARLWRDDLDGAERAASEAVNIYRESSIPELHPDRITADFHLADVLYARRRFDEAGEVYARTLKAQQRLYGDSSGRVADTMGSLAQTRLAQKRLPEAQELAHQALEISIQARGNVHSSTGFLQSLLAQVLTRQGKHAEGESLLRDALDTFAQTVPPDHQYVAAGEYLLGEIFLATGRLADAEAVLTASMNRWRRTNSPEWRAARSASALGEALHEQGRTREAEKYLAEGYRVLGADTRVDQDTRSKARERVVRFYTDLGERQKLEELLLATSGEYSGLPERRPN